jgi:hypothetical protein
VQTPGGQATLNLTGRITTAAFGRAQIPLYLRGQITTASFGRLYMMRLNLTGRITTAVSARMRTPPITGPTQNLSTSRITITASARFDQPRGLALQPGRITTTSWAALVGLPPPLPPYTLQLSGRITTAAQGRFRSPPNQFLAGRITTAARGRIARAGEFLAARGLTSSSLRGDALRFGTYFTGRIATTSWAGISPSAPLLTGTITATTSGRLQNLPLVPSAAPPVCKLDVTLADYLDLITSEHVGKPNYTQSVTASLQAYVDDQLLTAEMPCSFDVDIAVGEQLDFTGQWIGKTRFVNLPDVFFSWDAQGLGWEEANWKGPFDPPNALIRLDDDHYRLLLYATIVANHWDGSIQTAYTAWDTLFAGTGYQVVIQDFGNMTMMLGLRGTGHIDAVTQALFQSGDMDLKPEGVALIDYVFQAQVDTPFFAWDANTDSAAGWETGYWGILVPPGQGFVPENEGDQ